jgi:hypothetical protein
MDNQYFEIKAGSITPTKIQYQKPVYMLSDGTSYNDGDFAYFYNLGVYDYTNIEYPIYIQEKDTTITDVDTQTLLYDNVFGNKLRFTSINGGYYSGGTWYDVTGGTTNYITEFVNGIIIDNLTGLAWIRNTGIVDYIVALTATTGVNIFGYTDWRVGNVQEQATIAVCSSTINQYGYKPFNNDGLSRVNWWTNTRNSTTSTMTIGGNGNSGPSNVTTVQRAYMICRDWFLNT